PIRENDVGYPILQNCSLFGVQAVELQAHAEAGVAVDDSGFCVEGALVARNLDRDGRANTERGQSIDVAAAEANFRRSGDELGPSTEFDDLDRGHERAPFYGAFFRVFSRAAGAAWRCLFASCQHSIPIAKLL